MRGRLWFACNLAAAITATSASSDGPLCVSPTRVFTARVNLFAGELGYYVFEECGLDVLNPTLVMELGETYTFVQNHRSNYFHPIGFAYSPYGDQELKLEVEPGTTRGTNRTCVDTFTCDAPMYMRQGQYLGHYSNNADVAPVTVHEEDFGLDVYEPLFLRSPAEWTSLGPFEIKFKVTDDTLTTDLFYFCHVHEFMGGRIKVTDAQGNHLSQLDTPSLGYSYDYDTPGAISDFDKECGTFGLGQFSDLPNNPYCPDRFVCGTDPTSDPALHQFAQCIDAMNCAMMAGMSTGTQAQSEPALFVHQMIPHHQNAVNMAKALLKVADTKVPCDDLSNEDDPDCILQGILYEIVNTQNLQVR